MVRDILILLIMTASMGSVVVHGHKRLESQENHSVAAAELIQELESKVIAVQKYCAEKKEEHSAFCYYELMQSPDNSILRDAISITCPRCKVNVEWDLDAD